MICSIKRKKDTEHGADGLLVFSLPLIGGIVRERSSDSGISLVASSEVEQYRWLAMLRDALSKAQREVGVFCDTREAISWLADIR